MPRCIECRNCFTPATHKDVCLADHWDRSTDEFVDKAKDFIEYVSTKRYCSDFSEDVTEDLKQ